jgi:acyl-CoA synthetase (AMP-forming)/AMP-acid ligase II
VALAVRSQLVLARLLVALDGVAAALLLVPAEWPESVWTERFGVAGVEVVVADRPPPVGLKVGHCYADELLEEYVERIATTNHGIAGAGTRSTRIILPTSGTTGTPKLVSHTWATLTRAIKSGGESRCQHWGLLYELGRFAGLQVFLQALAARATLIFTDHLPDLEARLELLAALGCDALSATPTMWRKILMNPGGRRLPLRQVTLGGEIADDLVLRALAGAFPNARITHIYASTEAGVGFSVRDGRAGFPAAYLEEPPGGVELRVDATGRLWLRPPVRGQIYLGTGGLETAEGWIDSGDLVERQGDRFYFLGRASGAINVGGDKVFPEEVERVILELPEIALARVSARRNPIVGAVVEAAVVPRAKPGEVTGTVDLARRVREHCAARLPRHKVPALVQVLTDLKAEGTGKLTRR